MQCWSNAKDCLVGNCKNTEESIGNIKTRVFCQLLVICYDSPNRRNDGNNNSQNISIKNNNNNSNNKNNNNKNNNNNNNNSNNNNGNHVIIKSIKNAKSKYFLLPGLSRKQMGLLKRKKTFPIS